MRLDEVMSFAGRFAGSFELTNNDGTKIEHDAEYDLTVRVHVKETQLKTTRNGDLQLFFVVKPMSVSLRALRSTEENMVEIGGQVMTEAQFEAARFPLLDSSPAVAARPKELDALVPVDAVGTIIMPEDCPEPHWHQTHRYCPACSWTEKYVPTVDLDAFLDETIPGHAVQIRDPRPTLAEEEIVVPHGVRISSVQQRSNVAGSSQAERDDTLAAFLAAGAQDGRMV